MKMHYLKESHQSLGYLTPDKAHNMDETFTRRWK